MPDAFYWTFIFGVNTIVKTLIFFFFFFFFCSLTFVLTRVKGGTLEILLCRRTRWGNAASHVLCERRREAKAFSSPAGEGGWPVLASSPSSAAAWAEPLARPLHRKPLCGICGPHFPAWTCSVERPWLWSPERWVRRPPFSALCDLRVSGEDPISFSILRQ